MEAVPSYKDIWEEALLLMKNKMSKPGFETWLKTIVPFSFQDDVFTVGVTSEFARDWLEKRSSKAIRDSLRSVCGRDVELVFKVVENGPSEKNAPEGASRRRPSSRREPEQDSFSTPINSKYTFDNFVVGNSNRFAQSAALAVSQSPGRRFNPLFIYGGAGLGKTHLMHAIGNYISQEKMSLRAVYISAENFTNEFLASLRENKTLELRNRLKTVDIWLVDDIQFIAGKERTQDEFFHTFNALYETNKQIVISSDRPPRELNLNDDRLRTRLKSGLSTDIQPPDFETRIAILQRLSRQEGLEIGDDILELIASSITNNIRELEGALTTVIAFSSLTNTSLTIERTREVLKDILPDRKAREITIQSIQKAVADHFNLRVTDLKSSRRTRNIVLPRQVAMYLCREMTPASLPDIGSQFGGKDHSTVIHSCSQVKNLSLMDEGLSQSIKAIMEKLKQ